MDPNNEASRNRENQGVLAMSIEAATQATEKTLVTWFGLWRDVRGELVQRAVNMIEWIEGAQQGTTRLARSVVQRVDEVASTWIDANERVTLGVVRAVHKTGQGATALVSNT